jgi:hypothetical protein
MRLGEPDPGYALGGNHIQGMRPGGGSRSVSLLQTVQTEPDPGENQIHKAAPGEGREPDPSLMREENQNHYYA